MIFISCKLAEKPLGSFQAFRIPFWDWMNIFSSANYFAGDFASTFFSVITGSYDFKQQSKTDRER